MIYNVPCPGLSLFSESCNRDIYEHLDTSGSRELITTLLHEGILNKDEVKMHCRKLGDCDDQLFPLCLKFLHCGVSFFVC